MRFPFRLIPRCKSAADIDAIARQLPRSTTRPSHRQLRYVCESPAPPGVQDWMHWSLWQDRKSGEVWIHCTGGMAQANIWYGPGDASLVETAGA